MLPSIVAEAVIVAEPAALAVNVISVPLAETVVPNWTTELFEFVHVIADESLDVAEIAVTPPTDILSDVEDIFTQFDEEACVYCV